MLEERTFAKLPSGSKVERWRNGKKACVAGVQTAKERGGAQDESGAKPFRGF